jgi:hypothetical protein
MKCRNPEHTIVQLLHPKRFPGMSGRMAAIVGYVLGQKWSSPAIAEMTVTTDGGVLARHEGDIGFNAFLGDQRDLIENWRRLLHVAGLSEAQRKQAQSLFNRRVGKWGDKRWVRENPSHAHRAVREQSKGRYLYCKCGAVRSRDEFGHASGRWHSCDTCRVPARANPRGSSWISRNGVHVRVGDFVDFTCHGGTRIGRDYQKKRTGKVIAVRGDHVVTDFVREHVYSGGVRSREPGYVVSDSNFIGVSKRKNPSLGMPGMPHTWVTEKGVHVRGGDLIEFWDMGYGRGRGAKPEKRTARVNKMLVFDDHVQVNRGSFGERVDDKNFIRVVSKRREV